MKYIDKAIKAALASKCKVRVGCVARDRYGCICVGVNKYKTHPWLKKYGYKEWAGIHAEMDAFLWDPYAEWKEIYVARVFRNNKVALAKPCKYCMGMIIEMGVRRVIYTIDDNKTGEIKLDV